MPKYAVFTETICSGGNVIPSAVIGSGTADSNTFLRGDGNWAAFPSHPDLAAHDTLGLATQAELDAHAAASDPHTGYQKESEKNTASGYPGLDISSKLTGSQQVYGAALDTACQGNDARLSDARTPTAHKATHEPSGSDAMTIDASAGTGSLRTLGSSAQQAAAGDHTHPGGGAPSDAEYIVGAVHAGLSAERLVTDTATVAWDLATAGQAKANIPNDGITYAKLQNVSVTDRLLGRDTAGAGDAEELTVGGGLEFTGTGGIQRSALLGDVTAPLGDNNTTIGANKVSYDRMQDISAASRLLGRGSAGGSGDPEEIILGTNLNMSGTTLNATGGGGGISTLRTTADQTINGTAFQNITGLTFAVTGGVDYAFDFYITFRSLTTATGFRFAVNGPAGTLDFFMTYQTIANSETAGVATWLQKHSVARDSMTVLGTTIAANVDLHCRMTGRFKCTTSGTFAARAASEAANNDLAVQKGSWGTYF